MPDRLTFWILFNSVIVILLLLDLFVFHRKVHTIKLKEALLWSAFWIGLACAFGAAIFIAPEWFGYPRSMGPTKALEFFTGYLIEESLSVDNLFVFLVIFSYFKVPRELQYNVLFLGIIGALVMRGIFILVGVGLITRFHWIIYIFGAFLIYTGFTLLRSEGSEVDPQNNPVLRLFRRWFPVTTEYHGSKFFVRRQGLYATPLFLVLLVVETTDVLFALDSIPAVLAISQDAFIVYTSNVFAILGLRSIFFALSGLMGMFRFLHYGLAAILMFVGVKMIISAYVHIHTAIALGVVAAILAISVVASLLRPESKAEGPSTRNRASHRQ